jgi:hypothetical protein
LNVNVPTGILQAAVLELAVDEYTVIQDQMLALEDFVFVSSHGWVSSLRGIACLPPDKA